MDRFQDCVPDATVPLSADPSTSSSPTLRTKIKLYEIFSGDIVTDATLSSAARLFSENYGTWEEHSRNPWKTVKLGARRLREKYLPHPATESYYATVTVDGDLAGNAFYRRWR
ncbi:predicted protein [Histoplasma capsulatum G186AR]|uniref:Uncharacterized protein n=1 Tax=Ajellomyces capsulatus (strain G186AR / H82 / ATCC MYA-2454 / RMSCC 2432) TaxID=447093 RepID=C0NV00_AJECG|nr:uncharacterized protein HCBG_06764 [Histoplasma capsulatum G186AR]EEH04813.1 predicted protein [Histoplasma capsulatum G186AR]